MTDQPLPPEVTHRLIHRIVYQSDDCIATACGVVWRATRQEVREREDLTLQRGKQTCPECPDYLAELPDVVRMLLNPKKVTVESTTMIDIHEFGRRFTDRLLTISAENQGVGRIEAVRKYNTDPKFHAMVDTIVQAAVSVVREIEEMPVDHRTEALRGAFNEEAAGLLGWTQP
jgi:hypothetical protein